MQSTVVLKIPFAFGHAVLDPHYHEDALLVLRASGEIDDRPGSATWLMGPDFVQMRNRVQQLLQDRVEGRLLWFSGYDDGYPQREVLTARTREQVARRLIPTEWPARPTAEVMSMVISSWVSEIAAASGATITEMEMWESPRSGVFLDAASVKLARQDLRILVGEESQRWFHRVDLVTDRA